MMFLDMPHLEEVVSREMVVWYPLNPYGEGYVRLSKYEGKWSEEQFERFLNYLTRRTSLQRPVMVG